MRQAKNMFITATYFLNIMTLFVNLTNHNAVTFDNIIILVDSIFM